MWAARLGDTVGIVLIGDGVVGLLNPQRHARLWRRGPGPYRQLMDTFVARPGLTRVLSAIELAVGVWLARRAETSRGHRTP